MIGQKTLAIFLPMMLSFDDQSKPGSGALRNLVTGELALLRAVVKNIRVGGPFHWLLLLAVVLSLFVALFALLLGILLSFSSGIEKSLQEARRLGGSRLS